MIVFPSVQSSTLSHTLMAPPAAPHESGIVIQASIWEPRSTHRSLGLSVAMAKPTFRKKNQTENEYQKYLDFQCRNYVLPTWFVSRHEKNGRTHISIQSLTILNYFCRYILYFIFTLWQETLIYRILYLQYLYTQESQLYFSALSWCY